MSEGKMKTGKTGAGLATAGFILIIVMLGINLFGWILEWFPIIGGMISVIKFFSGLISFVGFILAVIGLILCIVGRENPVAKKKMGLAIAAIVIYVIGIVVRVIALAITIAIVVGIIFLVYYLSNHLTEILQNVGIGVDGALALL